MIGRQIPETRKIRSGETELKNDFITQGLNAPFGMALVGDTLYVANTDSLMAFHYTPGTTHIDGVGQR